MKKLMKLLTACLLICCLASTALAGWITYTPKGISVQGDGTLKVMAYNSTTGLIHALVYSGDDQNYFVSIYLTALSMGNQVKLWKLGTSSFVNAIEVIPNE